MSEDTENTAQRALRKSYTQGEIAQKRSHYIQSGRMTSIASQSSWARQAGTSTKADGSRASHGLGGGFAPVAVCACSSATSAAACALVWLASPRAVPSFRLNCRPPPTLSTLPPTCARGAPVFADCHVVPPAFYPAPRLPARPRKPGGAQRVSIRTSDSPTCRACLAHSRPGPSGRRVP